MEYLIFNCFSFTGCLRGSFSDWLHSDAFGIVLFFSVPLLFYIVSFAISFLLVKTKNKKRNQQLARVLSASFMSSTEFNEAWIVPSYQVGAAVRRRGTRIFAKEIKYGRGLKYLDEPGCYVILIFDEPVTNGDYSGYKDVYVGQSITMYQRVRDHFSGKGNGDVYADIKYGKYVYAQFFSCMESELNLKERELIRLFNATESYNKTSGGSAVR